MNLLSLFTVLAVSAIASPAQQRTNGRLDRRDDIIFTANELESGQCRRITFIYARGSGEPGNMGDDMGPALCNALKAHYDSSNVACQGVGYPYTADLLDNVDPDGTIPKAIAEAQRLFDKAHTRCPSTIITAAGYSQGAALLTAAITALQSPVRDQIAGTVLFGDTRNEQTHGAIHHYPKEDLLVICNPGDLLCEGLLFPTKPHGEYLKTVPKAVDFMEGRIEAAGGWSLA